MPIIKPPSEPAEPALLEKRRDAPLQTLARGLRILRFIGTRRDLVRLRDVARAFDLERSIALRILQSLEAEGFLRRHEALKAYSLGPAVEELIAPRSFIERLTETARAHIDLLMQETGQTSHVGILDQDSAVLVGVAMAPGPVAVQQTPGDLEALYCSAIGKAIYAYLSDARRQTLARRITFTRHKPATLGSVAALEAEAATIRRDGIAFDRDEGPAPLTCIAAPILDSTGTPVASVGISTIVPLMKRPIEHETAWIDAVRRCAGAIEKDLFRA
jgi:IclR family acetate operon transcriptional repressor